MKQAVKKSNTPSRNPFIKAKDIYLTKNKIAVTTKRTSSAKRGYTKTEKTKYYEQNASNIRLLKKAQGDVVRIGRTGNNYARLK